MAQNNSRSQNHDLAEGMTDNSHIKLLTGPDRGGVVNPDTKTVRDAIYKGRYWGQPGELPTKVAPDGTKLS